MTILAHLHSRYLNTKLHKVWVNEQEGVATFPIWNLSGQLLGYQAYSPDKDKTAQNDPRYGRYFTRLKDGKVGVWGLESWSLSNTLYVTEGIFDAARITYFGYSAIAVFGNALSHSCEKWLWLVKQNRPVVTICDNDEAGKKLQKYGHKSHTVMKYKDLGEADQTYVKALLL